MTTCKHCGDIIRPNQTGGWYHVETAIHRSDQRCFTYATPISCLSPPGITRGLTMPDRIQRKRVKGWRMPEGAVYVGRPTKWGNPFKVGDEVLRRSQLGGFEIINVSNPNEAVQLFRSWLDQWPTEFIGVNEPLDVNAELRHLRGKDLACWCRLDQPCHADVLLEIANA